MPGSSEPEAGRRKQSRCTHHWVIETAKGVTSKGLCKLCGSVRRFRYASSPKSLYIRGSKGKDFLFNERGETSLKVFDESVRLYEVRWRE